MLFFFFFEWSMDIRQSLDAHTRRELFTVLTWRSAVWCQGQSSRTLFFRIATVKNIGFNLVHDEGLSLPFDCVGYMLDLMFVVFAVKQNDKTDKPDGASRIVLQNMARIRF
jgi:hypothetical protein